MAFFCSRRRSSLLEINQRFRRTVLNTPLLTTFLRKRLSSCSWLSLGRKITIVNALTSFRVWNNDAYPAHGQKTRLHTALAAEGDLKRVGYSFCPLAQRDMTSIPGNHANQLVKLPEGCPQAVFIIHDKWLGVKQGFEKD